MPNTYIWFTEATPSAISVIHYMLLCHCPGVSIHWHLIPRFSMVIQIPFGRLTIVLDITGRCKVHSSPSSLDPEIRVKSQHLRWAWVFISSNPTSSSTGKGMSGEVRPEHRLPGPHSAPIYQVLWPGTLGLAAGWTSFSNDLIRHVHVRAASNLPSCQELSWAQYLGVNIQEHPHGWSHLRWAEPPLKIQPRARAGSPGSSRHQNTGTGNSKLTPHDAQIVAPGMSKRS